MGNLEMRLAIVAIIGFLGCHVPARFTTPVETVQTLERALVAKDWKRASECFTDEMRRENAAAIETSAFYMTDYWVGSVTVQNFLKPIPILSKSADLQLVDSDSESATVRIVYPDPADKEVRLRLVKLKRAADGNWRIGELFGRVRGRAAAGKAE
jgi:hypothetical protein